MHHVKLALALTGFVVFGVVAAPGNAAAFDFMQTMNDGGPFFLSITS